MSIREHKLNLSSGELAYFDAGAGRPLLHLHPAGGVRWTRVMEGLAKTRRLYAPVMPGFDGTAIHGKVSSMQELGRLAAEFVERVAGGPCDVVAMSFGGWVALWLAALRPDLVDHLVLEAPAGFRPPGSEALPSDPRARERLLFAHPEKIPPSSKSAEMEAANRGMMALYRANAATDEELLARIGAIDRMTLILHGTEDRMIPAESARLLKSRLPRSFLVYIWDAAHAIEVDQPERTLAVMQSFLERSEAFIVNWGTLAIDGG